MRVQFDLRPAGMLEKERKKSTFNFVRLMAVVLFILFLVANGFYIGTMTLKLMNLSSEIEMKEDEVNGLESSKQALEMEIKRLKDKEKVFVNTLKIMQDDLPILEVLNELENYMPLGLTANSIKFSIGTGGVAMAVVDASAATEEQIIQLTTGLSGSGVFSSVVMPTSTRDEKTGRVSFTLNLTLRPIGQLGGAVKQEAKP